MNMTATELHVISILVVLIIGMCGYGVPVYLSTLKNVKQESKDIHENTIHLFKAIR